MAEPMPPRQPERPNVAVSDSTPAAARPAALPDDRPSIPGYELIDVLGSGGMGRVWRARQLSVGREVALKLLDPLLAREGGFAERFMREARAAASIHHPNVVACFDAGEHDGRYYLALELVLGSDAAALAQRLGGRLQVRDAVAVALDCARGLEAVALAELIHRDIKPANIFLTGLPSEGGIAKLGDFGLARSNAPEARVTNTGAALGTPAYMAPEQARGDKNIDIRADIYALGASLYELLTGEPPYQGETAYAIVSQVLAGPAPDPRRLNAAVSPALAAVVRRAMGRTPAERYRSPTALREDLELVARDELPQAFRDSLAGNLSAGIFSRPAAADGAVAAGSSRHQHRPRPERWPALALAALLLLAIAAAAIWIIGDRNGDGTAVAPNPPAPAQPPGDRATNADAGPAQPFTGLENQPPQAPAASGVFPVPPTGSPRPATAPPAAAATSGPVSHPASPAAQATAAVPSAAAAPAPPAKVTVAGTSLPPPPAGAPAPPASAAPAHSAPLDSLPPPPSVTTP
jgi:serine/threonine protein kinase